MKKSKLTKLVLPASRWKRAIAIGLLLMLLLSLLPLYALAGYSYAGVDDYRYGATTHSVWEDTHSVTKTIAEAARVAGRTYVEWQGSLAAIFCMALQPGVFSDGCYGVSTAILLSVLVLSLLYFVCNACTRIFRCDLDAALIIAAIIAIACVQFVPAPVESYYWFNGGVYYTFFFSLALLFAALLIRRRERRTVWQCVFLPMLAVLIGLGNLITGLLATVLLLLYVLCAYWQKKRDPLLPALLLLLIAAFAVNVFSPGNGVRQAENAENATAAFPAILSAISDTFSYLGRWLITPAPYLLLAPVPLYWYSAPKSGLRFRCPLLLSIASILLLAAGFTPNEYALGFAGEARILDIQYYLFVLLFSINALWYTGWVRMRLSVGECRAKKALFLFSTVMLLAAAAITVGTRNMASVSAVLLQRNGKAQSYAETWERRLTILRDPTQADVVLPKLDSEPPLLCMVDIASTQTDPFYFFNAQLAAYFGKERVLREP